MERDGLGVALGPPSTTTSAVRQNFHHKPRGDRSNPTRHPALGCEFVSACAARRVALLRAVGDAGVRPRVATVDSRVSIVRPRAGVARSQPARAPLQPRWYCRSRGPCCRAHAVAVVWRAAGSWLARRSARSAGARRTAHLRRSSRIVDARRSIAVRLQVRRSTTQKSAHCTIRRRDSSRPLCENTRRSPRKRTASLRAQPTGSAATERSTHSSSSPCAPPEARSTEARHNPRTTLRSARPNRRPRATHAHKTRRDARSTHHGTRSRHSRDTRRRWLRRPSDARTDSDPARAQRAPNPRHTARSRTKTGGSAAPRLTQS